MNSIMLDNMIENCKLDSVFFILCKIKPVLWLYFNIVLEYSPVMYFYHQLNSQNPYVHFNAFASFKYLIV